ncbi:hypothetical protein Hanom_Chr12g01089781 [Helianthus anomalus]
MITYHETKKKPKVLHNSICLKIPPLSSIGTFRDQLAGDKPHSCGCSVFYLEQALKYPSPSKSNHV